MIEGNDREPVQVFLSQDGNNIQGSLDSLLFSGTLIGTLNGSTLHVRADVPPDKVKVGPKCAIQTEVLARNVTATAIAGDYTGRNACTGPFVGRLELKR